MNKNIDIRIASSADAAFFWRCWNDKLTQRMMKNGGEVAWADHLKWYNGEIRSSANLLVVGGYQGNIDIGVVRFISQGDSYFDVSLIIDPAFRGRGLAAELLRVSINFFKCERGDAILFAGFKKINLPSQRAFLAAGFSLCDIKDLPVTPKTLAFDHQNELISMRRV